MIQGLQTISADRKQMPVSWGWGRELRGGYNENAWRDGDAFTALTMAIVLQIWVYIKNIKLNTLKKNSWGWRADSVSKSICYFC